MCPHLEKAHTSEAMTHDEHDSSYTKPMELQEEPDNRVLPNVGFFRNSVSELYNFNEETLKECNA